MRFYWDRNALGVAYSKEDENSHYCSEWNDKVLGILQTSVLLVHLLHRKTLDPGSSLTTRLG